MKYHLFKSSTDRFQICTFNPYTSSTWSDRISLRLTGDKYYISATSIDERIFRYNTTHAGKKTCEHVCSVDNINDFYTLYPELFI